MDVDVDVDVDLDVDVRAVVGASGQDVGHWRLKA
jgi:hypothetical protein